MKTSVPNMVHVSRSGKRYSIDSKYLSHTGRLIPFWRRDPSVTTYCKVEKVAVNVASQLEGAKEAYEKLQEAFRVIAQAASAKVANSEIKSFTAHKGSKAGSGYSGNMSWKATGKVDPLIENLAAIRDAKALARKEVKVDAKVRKANGKPAIPVNA